MKATSLFGGVQVFIIFIAIIRSKFIAVLLGPTGMGIAGLLISATGLITALTNFGLGTSAVKNVAAANGTGNEKRIATIITVMRRWVWVTGLLGMITTIVISPILSRIAFGNSDYTFPFVWISVSLLLAQLSSGEMVLLQGMRKLQYLAKANLSGSIISLIITVPLYYLLGIKAIVPATVVASVITLACSMYFARKIKIGRIKVSRMRTLAEGKEMLTMGFMISFSGLITLGASFIVRIFISNQGGVEQVGLYNAGFAIVSSYVGLIFSAMGTDYYPRLSAVAHKNEECRKVVNQQAEIAILIIAPIIIFFFVFIHWIIILLYSNKFALVNEMILWAALGMFFKAISWSVAFIILAKGSSKLFFWNELFANIYTLLFNIIGYKFWGLTGLGISFLIGYFFYFLQIYFLSRARFAFAFENQFYIVFSIQFLMGLTSFVVSMTISSPWSYVIGITLILCSVFYSYKELDKRIGICNFVMSVMNDRRK